MIRIITLYLSLISLVFGGGLPEVTEKEEKKVIAVSHTVFEAIFVEQKISYLLEGKELPKKEAFKKYREGDSIEGNLPNVRIKRDITLLVTRSIKGELKNHKIQKILVEDSLDSECPHINDYGDYKTKQIYYISGVDKECDYRYKTVRELVRFSKLMNRKIIIGKLGERIGKVLKIEGIQPWIQTGSAPILLKDDSDAD